MLLANKIDVQEATVYSLCNNTPSIARFMKGLTTMCSAPANLNWLFALHKCKHRYLTLHDFIPGAANAMADNCVMPLGVNQCRISHSLFPLRPTDDTLGTSSPSAASCFARGLQSAGQTIESATMGGSSRSSSWTQWEAFCEDCGVAPTLAEIANPIPILLVFVVCYCNGTLSKSREPMQASTVEDVFHNIGQTMALMGHPNPHTLPSGCIEFSLGRLFHGFTKEDPPPSGLQPVSLKILCQLCLNTGQSRFDQVTCNLTIMGFFYLCQPGKVYAPSSPQSESSPFPLCDVKFVVDLGHFTANTTPLHLINQAHGMRLPFMTQ